MSPHRWCSAWINSLSCSICTMNKEEHNSTQQIKPTLIQAELCKSFIKPELWGLNSPQGPSSCTCTSPKQTLSLLDNLELLGVPKAADPLDTFTITANFTFSELATAAPSAEHLSCHISLFAEHFVLRHWGCPGADTGIAALSCQPWCIPGILMLMSLIWTKLSSLPSAKGCLQIISIFNNIIYCNITSREIICFSAFAITMQSLAF